MSDKKYYLGIDGGGSKTEFIIIDENNNISREQAEIRIKKLKCQHCKLKEK